jgi:hypothetical protein
MSKTNAAAPTGAALRNIFAPQALRFGPRDLALGERWARAYAVLNFPPKVPPAWLAHAANLPGVTLAVHGSPTDPTNLTMSLTRAISRTAGTLHAGGNALLLQRAEAQLADAQTLLRKIDQEQQAIFTLTVVLLVTATNEAEGQRRAKRVEGLLAAAGMRARPLAFRQEAGLLTTGPWGICPEELRGGAPFQVPSETVAAAFPFSSGGINHGRGVLIGHDDGGGLVMLDRWNPPEESGVTNRNWTILAGSGAGKSHTTTLAMIREWAQGARVVVIDPEREYRRLCHALGGTWVNAAGGEVCINPFEALPLPPDVDEFADEEEGQTAIAQQIQRVRTFLNLYLPELSDIQKALLRRAILAVNQERGIERDTDPARVPPGGWPTIRDLHAHCKAAAAAGDGASEWATLAALLEDAATGLDAKLWSGTKSPPTDVDFLVIDIHDLEGAEDQVQRAQYFSALGYAWDIIRQDRGERKLLVVDEAWMLVDPKVPQALSFLKKMSKRIRKYNGSLNVVTQNPIDFLHAEVAREGEPVLANASTRLLLRQEAKDLPTVAQLFSLSEAEQDKLASARVGEGLLIAGNSRAWVTVDTMPHEARLMHGR